MGRFVIHNDEEEPIQFDFEVDEDNAILTITPMGLFNNRINKVQKLFDEIGNGNLKKIDHNMYIRSIIDYKELLKIEKAPKTYTFRD